MNVNFLLVAALALASTTDARIPVISVGRSYVDYSFRDFAIETAIYMARLYAGQDYKVAQKIPIPVKVEQ
jgi:hypothetical protein